MFARALSGLNSLRLLSGCVCPVCLFLVPCPAQGAQPARPCFAKSLCLHSGSSSVLYLEWFCCCFSALSSSLQHAGPQNVWSWSWSNGRSVIRNNCRSANSHKTEVVNVCVWTCPSELPQKQFSFMCWQFILYFLLSSLKWWLCYWVTGLKDALLVCTCVGGQCREASQAFQPQGISLSSAKWADDLNLLPSEMNSNWTGQNAHSFWCKQKTVKNK